LYNYLACEVRYIAYYLRNRTVRKGFNKTPKELFTRRKPLGEYLRVFRCLAYITIPPQLRDNKLGDATEKSIFVSYETSTRQYRVYTPKTRTIRVVSSVRFDETTKGGLILSETGHNERYTLPFKDTESIFELANVGSIEPNNERNDNNNRTNRNNNDSPNGSN
jgi:hypothetical protein